MGKYYGKIGYGVTKETSPGVWTKEITERSVYGEMYKNTRRFDTTEHLNDSLSLSNKISFLADPYARQNFHLIVYASYMGTLWKVVSVEEEYPRLVLTLGGVYNDE